MPVDASNALRVCERFAGHLYSLQIRCHVSNVGKRVPASSSRYSRTFTPISHAARQTRRPSRFRPRSSIAAYAASVGTSGAYRVLRTRRECVTSDSPALYVLNVASFPGPSALS
jgi:hypothetical protein